MKRTDPDQSVPLANVSPYQRPGGRTFDQLRPVEMEPDFVDPPEGSVLISCGSTRVLCNATVQEQVPAWIQASGRQIGWITAEYAMLPRSTDERNERETIKPRGRSQEIKRLIGRSLRAGFDLTQMTGLTCIVDCDVLQADGGTRTASVTGGYVALAMALRRTVAAGRLEAGVFQSPVAAVSVGMVAGQPLLDLDYAEDSLADVDANIVMNGQLHLIELQSTSEGSALSRSQLESLLDLAQLGITELLAAQEKVLGTMKVDPA